MTTAQSTAQKCQTEYTLLSGPSAVFYPEPVTMLVGLEDEPDGSLRVYLGARYKGIYLRVPAGEESQREFRRAWNSGGHVFMAPVPSADVLHREVRDGD